MAAVQRRRVIPKVGLAVLVLAATVGVTAVAAETAATPVADDVSFRSRVCGGDGNDIIVSPSFNQSVTALYRSLVANASVTGFATATAGRDPDQVYGLAIECKQCISDLTTASPSPCEWPIILSGERCMARYSVASNFLGIVDTSHFSSVYTQEIVSHRDRFDKKVRSLLDNLISTATGNQSGGRMFAYGDVPFRNDRTIHGLVQCTRDLLSPDDCKMCLENLRSTKRTDDCCSGRPSVVMGTGSCIIRYSVPYSISATIKARSTSLMRETLLIVATSIAAAAFHL